DQRHRRLHEPAAPQDGAARPAAAHPHAARPGLQSAGSCMHLSIRWRLTLWHSLALAGLLLGFAVLVYGLMAHALYEQVDRALLAEASQLRQDERLTAQAEQ